MPGPDVEVYGAFHTSDIPYFMDTLAKSDRPWEASDKIADMLSSYWVNFATTGDPNGKDLPRWSPVGDSPMTMELGDKPGAIPVASSVDYSFLRDWLLASH
jgi:carboxylesterase type B